MMAPFKARRSAITRTRAGSEQIAGEPALGMAASDKSDRSHARCVGRSDAGSGIFNNDTIFRGDLKTLGREQKKVGRRFTLSHEIPGEQARLEKSQEIGNGEAQADTIERGGRRHSFRPANPGQRVGGVRDGT